MTGHIKTISISVLFTIVIIIFALVRAVDEFNNCMRVPALKAVLVDYLESVIQGTVSADGVRIYAGMGTGIAFYGPVFEVRDKYRFSADEAELTFSIINRFKHGHWLKGLRIIRPKITLRADALRNADQDLAGYLPELVIKDPDVTLYIEGHALGMKGGFFCNIAARPDKEGKILIAGTMEFRDTSVQYDDNHVTVRGLVRLEGGVARISGLSISDGKTTVTVSGRYVPGSPGKFSGNVSMDRLDIGSGGGAGGTVLAAVLGFAAGSADLSATNMRLFGIPVDQAFGRAETEQGKLRITGIRATGRYVSGEGAVTIHSGSHMVFDVSFILKDYSIGAALSPASGSPPLIEGSINLKGRLWGTDASINGELSFSSFNGRIKKYTALSKIFSALNLYKLILNRNPGMEKRGFPYNSIVTHAVISDSIIKINDLYLDSNSVQMSGVGAYDLRTGSVDMIIGLRMLESIDAVINAIPVFGWIIRGTDKGFFVMDLKVTGGLDDLSARPVPVRFISRRVGDIIIRTLMLPYVFFTRPASLVPGINEKK